MPAPGGIQQAQWRLLSLGKSQFGGGPQLAHEIFQGGHHNSTPGPQVSAALGAGLSSFLPDLQHLALCHSPSRIRMGVKSSLYQAQPGSG